MASTNETSVLLVEDNFFMATLLSEKIIQQGLTVVHAKDGASAIEELQQRPPRLIVIDMPLAGAMDGFSTLEAVWKQSKNTIPVLVLMPTHHQASIERLEKLGFKDFLIKLDISADGIVSKIVQLVTGSPLPSMDVGPQSTAAAEKSQALTKASGIRPVTGDLAPLATALKHEV